MAETRWDRLQNTLADAGITAKVDTRSSVNGTSHSIVLTAGGGHLVRIGDRWWRKNTDIWVGWNVWLEDRDSIVVKDYCWTKKRSEVLAHVQDALHRAGR